MRNKFLIIILFFLLVSACSGMGQKRSDKADEFLIEKKNPLAMPPDIAELPKPKDEAVVEETDNSFKETLKSNKLQGQKSTTTDASATIEESIIKKIEQ